jgi:hypothetical protein
VAPPRPAMVTDVGHLSLQRQQMQNQTRTGDARLTKGSTSMPTSAELALARFAAGSPCCPACCLSSACRAAAEPGPNSVPSDTWPALRALGGIALTPAADLRYERPRCHRSCCILVCSVVKHPDYIQNRCTAIGAFFFCFKALSVFLGRTHPFTHQPTCCSSGHAHIGLLIKMRCTG